MYTIEIVGTELTLKRNLVVQIGRQSIAVSTLAEAAAKYRAYIDAGTHKHFVVPSSEANLCHVREDGHPIADISYNCRIWVADAALADLY